MERCSSASFNGACSFGIAGRICQNGDRPMGMVRLPLWTLEICMHIRQITSRVDLAALQWKCTPTVPEASAVASVLSLRFTDSQASWPNMMKSTVIVDLTVSARSLILFRRKNGVPEFCEWQWG
ncbi:hypothetical protein pipiens_008191 [Culex pipiens pipiens]|uniref:Uncharacterized protein n=1 Tax=Culex pipiens pipiens TaxID=38569 RepID=A0ABD1DID4_CULPP